MTLSEHLDRLKNDKTTGRTMTKAEAKAELDAINADTRSEMVPHLVRINALLPHFMEAASAIKAIRNIRDDIAGIMRDMLDQDVSAE